MADSNTYRAFALFVQGERVLNCTEYTPVDMKIIEDDFKTGAMDTAITLDGGMEKMSASFKVSGSDSGVMGYLGNDSNLLIVFYVQIMPDDLVMQLHRF
ncbi:phage major tail tube protein [Escherichia coli]|nr:phage major tail tube protein [Escherichia coli]